MKTSLFSKKSISIILCIVIFSAVICVIDSVIQPGYWIKSASKVTLFAIIAVFYLLINKEEIKFIKKLFIPHKRDIPKILAFATVIYAVIVGGYFLLRPYFDFSQITSKLTSDTGVSKENFIYVALYISIINSLLEELLFRGLGFLILKRTSSRSFAYIFSSLAFALYHSGMTAGYFNIGVFIFTLTALFAGGLIFSFLDERSQTVYPSYLVHMSANLGINTVGMILFNS